MRRIRLKAAQQVAKPGASTTCYSPGVCFVQLSPQFHGKRALSHRPGDCIPAGNLPEEFRLKEPA
jgi:hypothetical protein